MSDNMKYRSELVQISRRTRKVRHQLKGAPSYALQVDLDSAYIEIKMLRKKIRRLERERVERLCLTK